MTVQQLLLETADRTDNSCRLAKVGDGGAGGGKAPKADKPLDTHMYDYETKWQKDYKCINQWTKHPLKDKKGFKHQGSRVAKCLGHTEPGKKACTWLQEIYSCSCLTFLPGFAWLLLNKICKPLLRALYTIGKPPDNVMMSFIWEPLHW